MYTLIGLGNPGEEYAHTRHNAGRLAVEEVSKLKVNKLKVLVPDTFMNKTGSFVAKFIKSNLPAGRQGKAAEKLIVVYDDLDLPLGSFKVSFNKSSGGHRGLESIIRALKTKEFTRIRIGISPTTPSGKLKKPKGDKAVEKHILSDFKKSERDILKKVFKKVVEAVETLVEEGREIAMNRFN